MRKQALLSGDREIINPLSQKTNECFLLLHVMLSEIRSELPAQIDALKTSAVNSTLYVSLSSQ